MCWEVCITWDLNGFLSLIQHLFYINFMCSSAHRKYRIDSYKIVHNFFTYVLWTRRKQSEWEFLTNWTRQYFLVRSSLWIKVSCGTFKYLIKKQKHYIHYMNTDTELGLTIFLLAWADVSSVDHKNQSLNVRGYCI